MAAFSAPQVVLLVADVERSVRFYARFRFAEVFRTPRTGAPIHADVELDGIRLGFATTTSTRDDHGLEVTEGRGRAAVAIWTDDVDSAVQELAADGVPVLHPPAPWLGHLRIAWVEDPDGHPVQLVQEA